MKRSWFCPLCVPALLLLGAAASRGATLTQGAPNPPPALACEALPGAMRGVWPDRSTHVVSAKLQPAGPYTAPPRPDRPPAPPVSLPEHCEVLAVMHERTGVGQQHYAIRFHLRLPRQWNGRFLFQGGGGSNGFLGDALGLTSPAAPLALTQGYAVVSQDSGHDNASNNDPTHGGTLVFGFDPQARADYGYASLKPVTDAAKALIGVYYGAPPRYSYFVGCSKGGQEGMMLSQRDPDAFDGIVAAAPGFSLPRAALAEAWDVQQIAKAEAAPPERSLAQRLAGFPAALADADLRLVADVVLATCDGNDGLRDGMVSDFESCTAQRVVPELRAKLCRAGGPQSCLTAAILDALMRMFAGPKDAAGRALYSDWQWDVGVASPGWRIWKLGSTDGKVPALNVALGGESLAAVFTTPPTPLSADPVAALGFQLGFELPKDAGRIDATSPTFRQSAWHDIAASSTDLTRFKAHGGKLIIPHGVSDPVFSIRDTLRWYGELRRRDRQAENFVRVFAVPGMNHCGGGPATDNFDAFTALRAWVEQKQPPDSILAAAGASSPWPGRTRPLCPYPKVARYAGGEVESASSFACR